MFVLLFVVLIGYIGYFTQVEGKDIINSPYNPRLDLYAKKVVRGKILDKDGNVLAKTVVDSEGNEVREYPYGQLYGHVVGYTDQGKSGLESTENFHLLTSNSFFLEKISNGLKGEKNIGDTVITTLDTKMQQAAYDALGSNNGAVVAIEPSTGKILTVVSKPTFDPNTVSADWEELIANEDGILVNRAMQGQYAPGSTFKIVTALAYMRQNPDYENYTYNCTGEITINGTEIHCYRNAVHGQQNLADAIANSCNTAFSDISQKLDYGTFKKTAESLLFDHALPGELPYKQSKFNLSSKDGASEKAMTAFGQGKLQVSPYHMALITAAIANGGTLMEPYLVSEVQNNTGSTVEKYMPDSYRKLMEPSEAEALSQQMKGVVDYGTAKRLSGLSYTVAGKTGTSEYSVDKEKTHSWFIGFSNVDHPDVALSVIIENSDRTGSVAMNVARQVFDAYYSE